MQKKVFIKSYGCQMNEYDSAKIAALLANACGLDLTIDPNIADLIILNTCAIRAKATEKVFSELGRLRFLKKKNPKLILAVGGCVSIQEQKNIFHRAPYVDIVFGPQTLHRLPNMYENVCKKRAPIIDITSPPTEKFDYLPMPTTTGPSASISIMEGCNKFCSYCVVPYTRGVEVSRNLSDILAEVITLISQGAKEIQLLGQNVNAYRDPSKNYNFSTLLHEIAAIKAVARVRFSTSHPAEFSDELIMAFKQEEKLANHVHLPIQSGSNRILKLMRRGYTQEEYQIIVAKLRNIRPDISISTDLIVGFPTETAEDFAATMEVVKKINFDASFSFIYSPRLNTPAANMIDDLPVAEKKKRLSILQNQLANQSLQYSQTMIGSTQKVLVTGNAPKNPKQFSGRADNNRIVNFSSIENVLGKIVKVKITAALANSLLGKL